MNVHKNVHIWPRAIAWFHGNGPVEPSRSFPEITGQILQIDRISSDIYRLRPDSDRIIFAQKATQLPPHQLTPTKTPILGRTNFHVDFPPRRTRHFRARQTRGFNLPIPPANL
jgi:hypothetical protein